MKKKKKKKKKKPIATSIAQHQLDPESLARAASIMAYLLMAVKQHTTRLRGTGWCAAVSE